MIDACEKNMLSLYAQYLRRIVNLTDLSLYDYRLKQNSNNISDIA